MLKCLLTPSFILVALPALAAGPHGFAESGPVNPLAPKGFDTAPIVTTVSDIIANAKDDQIVVLRGAFVEHIKGEKYLFIDTQGGKIQAELDDDRDWSMVTKDATMEIRAKVDKDFHKTTLDVLDAKPLW